MESLFAMTAQDLNTPSVALPKNWHAYIQYCNSFKPIWAVIPKLWVPHVGQELIFSVKLTRQSRLGNVHQGFNNLLLWKQEHYCQDYNMSSFSRTCPLFKPCILIYSPYICPDLPHKLLWQGVAQLNYSLGKEILVIPFGPFPDSPTSQF